MTKWKPTTKKLSRLHMRWASAGRCSTCAYRAGTVASTDEDDVGLVRLRYALLNTCKPFYCHEQGPIAGRRKLCNGHMDAITARTKSGFYKRNPPDAPHVLTALRVAHQEREDAYRAAMRESELEA